MATDRDANECGLGILDAIERRKNILRKSSRTSSVSDLYTSLRCVHVLQISYVHICVYFFLFWSTIMWIETEARVLCTDVSTPFSISRFLWGQPPTPCSGLPEGLFSRVWSQSERSQVQRSCCHHRLSSQRGSVTHSRHQSTAHKYPPHSRDCKIIWIFFLKTLTFLSFVFSYWMDMIDKQSIIFGHWLNNISTGAAVSPPTGQFW